MSDAVRAPNCCNFSAELPFRLPLSENTSIPASHSFPHAITKHSPLRHIHELNRAVQSTAANSINRFHGDLEISAPFAQDDNTVPDIKAGLGPFVYLLLHLKKL